MDDDVAIKVENVSKKFSRTLKRSMLYGVNDIGRNALGMSSHPEKLRKSEFWAVDDVSFELRKGEILGLIGPNGSGKSTLLKMLNGIYWPDKGRIMIDGKVGALIEVGAGFHPMLTGRENIYINAAILGMTKEETDERFDDIIEFADIGDFLDTPVKFYSSGMYVRLGFAVAIHCEPDVLLIDEVLAVGDIGFRAKCINTIVSKLDEMSVVLVSHNMPQVSRYCNSAMLLNKGCIVDCSDDVPSIINKYNDIFQGDAGRILNTDNNVIKEIIINDLITNKLSVDFRKSLDFDITLELNNNTKYIDFSILFMNKESQVVSQVNSKYNKEKISNIQSSLRINLTIPEIFLSPGIYSLWIVIQDYDTNEFLCGHYDTIQLEVVADFTSWAPTQMKGKWQLKQ
ncbi:MAG: ATP-binding cassette domain-containing protein [Thermoplasmata archaeon]|nr:ATP-binding cassette domain-containing protein [Thermoplasmata archaeon]